MMTTRDLLVHWWPLRLVAFAPERHYTSAGMTFVPHSRVLPRALWRPAIFFFAVAQLLLAFAPLLEGRQGSDARAHVEEAGTTLHHAHSETRCAACTARVLMGSAGPGSSYDPALHLTPSRITPADAPSIEPVWTTHSRSRAPPVIAA